MSYINQAINFFETTVARTKTVAQEWSQSWQNAIDAMRLKAREFMRVFSELEKKKAIAAKNPSLYADYQDLMKKGQWIKNTIDSILDSETSLNGLGALPLIPIAIILAAISAITAWLAPAYEVQQRISIAEKMLNKGIDPSRYLERSESGAIETAFEKVGDTAKNIGAILPLAIGGILLWKFYPQIKKMLK